MASWVTGHGLADDGGPVPIALGPLTPIASGVVIVGLATQLGASARSQVLVSSHTATRTATPAGHRAPPSGVPSQAYGAWPSRSPQPSSSPRRDPPSAPAHG